MGVKAVIYDSPIVSNEQVNIVFANSQVRSHDQGTTCKSMIAKKNCQRAMKCTQDNPLVSHETGSVLETLPSCCTNSMSANTQKLIMVYQHRNMDKQHWRSDVPCMPSDGEPKLHSSFSF